MQRALEHRRWELKPPLEIQYGMEAKQATEAPEGALGPVLAHQARRLDDGHGSLSGSMNQEAAWACPIGASRR